MAASRHVSKHAPARRPAAIAVARARSGAECPPVTRTTHRVLQGQSRSHPSPTDSAFESPKTIFKQVYNSYYNQYIIKHKIQLEKLEVKFGSDTFLIEVDIIGKILYKIEGYNCLRYIEEILEVNFL